MKTEEKQLKKDITEVLDEAYAEKKPVLPEAPASSTFKATSPNGFEIMITSRDFDDKELTKKQIAHLLNLDKALKVSGFTPIVKGFTKPQKTIDIVPDRKCPLCKNDLVYATTKTGKRFIKCSTNKWDFTTKQVVGCAFVEWPAMINSDL